MSWWTTCTLVWSDRIPKKQKIRIFLGLSKKYLSYKITFFVLKNIEGEMWNIQPAFGASTAVERGWRRTSEHLIFIARHLARHLPFNASTSIEHRVNGRQQQASSLWRQHTQSGLYFWSITVLLYFLMIFILQYCKLQIKLLIGPNIFFNPKIMKMTNYA